MAQLDALPPNRKRALILELRKRPTAASLIRELFSRDDPRDFARDVLGLRPTARALAHGYTDAWTPDQDRILVSLRDNRRTAVPSGHGNGKTMIAAVGALWFLYSRKPSKVITTAPTWAQVEKLLWREIGKLWSNAIIKLPGKKNTVELFLDDDWFAQGLSTRRDRGDLSATRFQGYHSANVMVIYDEATGVPVEIRNAGMSLTLRPTDRELAIGNPTDPSAWFKTACDARDANGARVWFHIQMDCYNHPNVVHHDPDIIPGAVTKEWIDDQLAEFGSEDSPLFKAKVRGLWPDQSAEALIRLAWIEQARLRLARRLEAIAAGDPIDDDRKGVAAGLDVAGEGTDLSVFSILDNGRWQIPEVPRDERFPLWKGGRTWLQGRELNETIDMTAASICHCGVRALALDDTAIGSGVRAGLERLIRDGKLPRYHLRPVAGNLDRARNVFIIPVNFGATPSEPEKFQDAKDELWWKARKWLEKGPPAMLPTEQEWATYGLPKGNDLGEQLTRAIYGQDGNGKIIVFDKRGPARGASEQLQERIKLLPTKSPDVAHSLILSVRAHNSLRVGEPAQPAKTAKELFDMRTRQLIEQSSGRKPDPTRHRNGGRRAPWQRRGR